MRHRMKTYLVSSELPLPSIAPSELLILRAPIRYHFRWEDQTDSAGLIPCFEVPSY
jgi:hypothetical protein